jgi:hypothetical protein
MIFGGGGKLRPTLPQGGTTRGICRRTRSLWYLQWSEFLIVFDRRDHPNVIPHPEMYPLIVEPIVGSKCLTKVLMDGGVVSTSCTLRPSMVWALCA